MSNDDEKCTEYEKGHIYQFRDGAHRCACGKVAIFDDMDRGWH